MVEVRQAYLDMVANPQPVVLSNAGTSIVVDIAGPRLPRILHWGADLGQLNADELADLCRAGNAGVPRENGDEPLTVTLLPSQAEGWSGRPGLSGHRPGGRFAYPRLTLTAPVTVTDTTLLAESADTEAGLAVRTELRLEPHGVIRLRHTLTNTGTDEYTLDELLCLMRVPGHATELLDFTGRWIRERSPQRSPFHHGSRIRESRRGRTGHDATGLLIAGTAGFGFRHGEVWGVHIAWSGNHLHLAERQVEGPACIGGGELLTSGEVRLAPGESYTTPWAFFIWSDEGLDGLSARLHRWMRDRPHHPRSPRPVVLNTWEAVYFDHNLDRLRALADRAAAIGVERFVLDDGWFLGRRDDTAGLGDWFVDPAVWPEGLRPLVDHVRGLGMQFGLWVEPEMINPNSELARAHPDWFLAAPDRTPVLRRSQLVLNLARPEAYAYILERLDALVSEYDIDYLKWDHNRDLTEAVHEGAAGTHAQTLAVYRLLDELRSRHPRLEIESCSSGGARIDLGILERTDRVWGSDTNDPLERQAIQRWTGLLLPPELIGSHVGPATAHTTGRTTELGFRCATALLGHAGIEWDITRCTPEELAQLADWISAYKRLRPLLHSGTVVRADHPDPAAWLYGVVSPDKRDAVFVYAQLATSAEISPARLRLPGLDPVLRYRVTTAEGLEVPSAATQRAPGWLTSGVTLPGVALAAHGLEPPMYNYPGQALVLELHAQ